MHTYSDAFFEGQGRKAYGLLAPRSRYAITYNDFAQIVRAAHEVYVKLPIRSYRACVSGNAARVTYRYDVRRLD